MNEARIDGETVTKRHHFVEVNKMHTIQTRFRDAAQTSCPRHKRRERPTLNAFFAKSQHKISVNRAISAY
nr:MAG TPA: hypothetical protein [Caudoviricetes sp.]